MLAMDIVAELDSLAAAGSLVTLAVAVRIGLDILVVGRVVVQ